MSFIDPMLAKPMKEDFAVKPEEWVAEEKIDGIRLEVEIDATRKDLLDRKRIVAWSRYGRPLKLSNHLIDALNTIPVSIILDGELYVPGKRSYGVKELANSEKLVFGVFDVLELLDKPVRDWTYDQRQKALCEIMGRVKSKWIKHIKPTVLTSVAHAQELCNQVWARDGEGLILKRRKSIYIPGKRTKDWIKLKDLKSAVLRVTEFIPSTGEIVDRGPYAIAILKDEAGNYTRVKVRNDEELRRLERIGDGCHGDQHPWVGRELRIEFQERTPDGSYRHPRWDRWENE